MTLVFFALIGFVFLATQYLQFVLGYTPLQAGIRTLPFAVAMMIVAPLSSKVVEWVGTKRVVVDRHADVQRRHGGRVDVDGDAAATRGSRSRWCCWARGMGLAMAPSTESIMGSLPRDKPAWARR